MIVPNSPIRSVEFCTGTAVHVCVHCTIFIDFAILSLRNCRQACKCMKAICYWIRIWCPLSSIPNMWVNKIGRTMNEKLLVWQRDLWLCTYCIFGVSLSFLCFLCLFLKHYYLVLWPFFGITSYICIQFFWSVSLFAFSYLLYFICHLLTICFSVFKCHSCIVTICFVILFNSSL